MIKIVISIFILLFTLIACQAIETGDSLDQETISRIKDLGLLESNEQIIKYYSNYKKDKAGNFFTNKRIAHYWLDQNNESKTEISFAYYRDIMSIDTNFKVQDFDIPYMTIRKKDNSSFKVFIDGSNSQMRDFFNEAIDLWKRKRQ